MGLGGFLNVFSLLSVQEDIIQIVLSYLNVGYSLAM